MNLNGRREILSPVEYITKENVIRVLTDACGVHNENAQEIDYLYRYVRGEQPILERKKTVRPEINNKVCENHAVEVANFTAGYFLGEPLTYVRRGDEEKTSEEIRVLNDYMFYEDKASHDKDLATWMAVCGVGYRMVLPDRYAGEEDDSPFELDTPDPRFTFMVYNSGFAHRRLMGVRIIMRRRNEVNEVIYCGYTPTHYFEAKDGILLKWEPHALGDIPIFEYKLNMYRMGSFEPAVPLLDALNKVESDRLNGLESFVQSFLKFKNCEVDAEAVKNLSHLGAIMIKSTDGVDGDVEILSQELNQTQTQTLVDYLYEQVLTICGLPSTARNGGMSTSDSGSAVLLRNGWQQTEARAKDTELLFKRSEKQFLKLVLKIMRETREVRLILSDVECKFTRRQHDNLLTKTQSLLHMLEAGLAPEVAISTCGLFNDPMDVTAQSKDYLEKWKPVEEEPSEQIEGEDDEQPNTDRADQTEVTVDAQTTAS